jgi:hypothetical protein
MISAILHVMMPRMQDISPLPATHRPNRWPKSQRNGPLTSLPASSHDINALRPPEFATWRAAFGAGWINRFAKVLGTTRVFAWYAASGQRGLARRRLIMLERWARQKRNARAARLERRYEQSRRATTAEDSALDTLLSWIETELAKKK